MATRKRRSGLIFFVLALLLILILAVVAYVMRDQLMALIIPKPTEPVSEAVVPAPVMYDIVVVLQPIKRGATVTEAMLGTVAYPQESMVEGLFYTDIEDVIGKRAKFDLDPGTPLTPSLLSEGTTGSFISFDVPQGMVAISIPIPIARYAVSYALQPGDFVNILAALQIIDLDTDFQTKLPNNVATIVKNVVYDAGGSPIILPIDYTLRIEGSNLVGRIYQDPSIPDEFLYVVPSEGQRPRWITHTVVQNAKVLWVGELPLVEEPAPTPVPEETTAEQQPTAVPEVIKPQLITVAVTPQDAETINYLILAQADINFVLRSAGDTQIIQTEAVTLQFLMDQYNIPYPSKLPYGLEMSPRVIEEVVPVQ